MWTCPKCKHKFCNRNQSHSCGNYSVEGFLERKSQKAIALFKYFLSEYRKIGDFELDPVKTRVALVSRMRFSSVNRIGKDFIDVHFVLVQQYPEARCFQRIENIGNRFFVHHLRIRDKADLNAEIKKYMKLAYAVGKREHLRGRQTKTRNAGLR